jgi:hypothetical protein
MTHAKEQTMTPLRARMIEDMKLAGLAERTQEVYLQAVRGLAKRYDRSPDQLTEEEVRRYLLGVREQGAARGRLIKTGICDQRNRAKPEPGKSNATTRFHYGDCALGAALK